MLPNGFSSRQRGFIARYRRAALLLVVLSLVGPAALRGVEEEGEALVPGQVREGPIAAKEARVYRLTVTDVPLLITVEQRGIDLVVEAQGPAARVATDAGDLRWGPEVLLLDGMGSYRIEIHSREQSTGPGHYAIRVEAAPEDAPRRAALSLMSRAGQEAFAKTPEAWNRALSSYREALAAWHSLGEHRWEAEALTAIAALERNVSELPAAASHYRQAQALWQDLEEPHRKAATLNELGRALLDAGDSKGAREPLQSSLALWQRLEERYDEMETRSNLCFIDQRSGALQAALTCYEEPLAFFHDLDDQPQEARLLNNVGGIDDALGEPDAALDAYEKALTLHRQLGNRLEEARTLNNIALIHRTLGEWQEALRLYDQTREILTPLGNRSLEGARLNNVGFTYNSLGEPERARTFLEDALKLRKEIKESRGQIVTLNNLGTMWRGLGDLKQALAYHQQALDLAKTIEDPRQEAISHLRLGEVQLDRGDSEAALHELDSALTFLKETGYQKAEVQAQQLRGRALAQAGRPREALPVLQEVLARCRTLHDRAGEAEALRLLAATQRSVGLREEALAQAQEAVARVEELRTGFVSPDLRASFLATQRQAYELLIDLLMDRQDLNGHDRTAFEISERAHARSLVDVLHSEATRRPGSTVPADLLERRQTLRHRLTAKTDKQLQLNVKGGKPEDLERETVDLLAKLDSVEAEIRHHDPQYAGLSQPQPISAEGIAGLLDPGTLLLEYSLGEKQSFLWAVGANSFRSFVLPPRREIESRVRQVYKEVSTVEVGAPSRNEAKESLSRMLLAQVWSGTKDLKRLVIVPDAALHFLPFAALPVPEPGQGWDAPGSRKPLLEHLEVAYLPSATTLALQRQRLEHRAPASQWASILADPVFDPNDPRLARASQAPPQSLERRASRGPRSGSSVARRQTARTDPQRGGEAGGGLLPGFERLPSSRKEAEAIARLAPPGKVRIALDLDANRDAVLSGGLHDYRFIHFATHGLADPRHPELSGLMLSLVDAAGHPREGFLALPDIYELALDADLVVLSGCRTALGKEVRGEGLMGLTRGFLYAGVPRVVASLWPIDDQPTAKLMTQFYKALWQKGLSPAAALREAQQSLRSQGPYRNPHYWAGFVLQGDWR